MFTVDVVYLLSFAVFCVLAYRMGKEGVSSFLKDGIGKIISAMETANHGQDQALTDLQETRKKLSDYQNSREERERKVKEKADFLMQKHQEALHTLLETREETFFEHIAYDRLLKMKALKKQVLDATIAEILRSVREDPKMAQAFNEHSFNLIKAELEA